MNNPAEIGSYRCGSGCPLLIVAGPCVLEELELTLRIARRLAQLRDLLEVPVVFKASFDKANRTSVSSFRGVGLEAGLQMLEQVRQQTGLPVTTDIHLPWQAGPAAEVCQMLQIPAFLARQTDLLLAAASSGVAVHVKKGQFMAPSDMRHVVAKLESGGCRNALLCERGTFFGYGRLVNDMRSLVSMRQWGVPIVFDATHSVQEPGGFGRGDRRTARDGGAVGSGRPGCRSRRSFFRNASRAPTLAERRSEHGAPWTSFSHLSNGCCESARRWRISREPSSSFAPSPPCLRGSLGPRVCAECRLGCRPARHLPGGLGGENSSDMQLRRNRQNTIDSAPEDEVFGVARKLNELYRYNSGRSLPAVHPGDQCLGWKPGPSRTGAAIR